MSWEPNLQDHQAAAFFVGLKKHLLAGLDESARQTLEDDLAAFLAGYRLAAFDTGVRRSQAVAHLMLEQLIHGHPAHQLVKPE